MLLSEILAEIQASIRNVEVSKQRSVAINSKKRKQCEFLQPGVAEETLLASQRNLRTVPLFLLHFDETEAHSKSEYLGKARRQEQF